MNQPSLKQPKALPVLFFFELWERYGFYTVQALLVLYLVNIFHFTDKHAYAVYSGFSALMYASPVIGGYLADKFLGFRKAIVIGALLYILGFLIILINVRYAFYFSLAVLIAATGYFKANVSSLLGVYYKKDDPRRDSGFTIFYLGINIGSLVAPIVSSWLAINYGYLIGFSASAAGMVLGLIVFLARKKTLGNHGYAPHYYEAQHKKPPTSHQGIMFGGTFILIVFMSLLIDHDNIVNYALAIFSALTLLYILYHAVKFKSYHVRLRLFALLILIAVSVIFWTYYIQQYTTLVLFSSRNVDLTVFGYRIPASIEVAFTAFFVVALAPAFAKLWIKIEDKRWNPSDPMKFALSLIIMSLSFFIINFGIHYSSNAHMALIWLGISSLIRAIGELLISPIGLSVVTNLSPKKLVGMMMGVWFLSVSAAQAIGGKVADLAAVPQSVHDKFVSLHIYDHAFWIYGLESLGFGIVVLLCVPFINRMINTKK